MSARKLRVRLPAAQQTLIPPLYGRAVMTRACSHLIDDPKAVEIVEALDYDFSRLDGSPSLFKAVLRTAIFDHWVRGFLGEHPSTTVVEIGAGLNTRFDRLDNGRLHWVDLDLPETIALRRRFFNEDDRYRMLAGSVLDATWIDAVRELPAPYFLVSEGCLMYVDVSGVERVLATIAERFGTGTRLAFDTCGSWILRNQDQHELLRRMARVVWTVDDPGDLARFGLRRLRSCNLATPPVGVRSRVPLEELTGLRRLARQDVHLRSYRLNLFEL